MSRKLKPTTDSVDFVCGFCGQHCTADMTNMLVSHRMPMCKKFEKLEPDAFMTASRYEHMGKGTDPTTGKTLN